ncbi:MAG: hypothetical protein RM022_006640 [Nostoc sp. EfeVER01]|uniref:hypothetical protein n=1 Tax=Nostoc sp. EfeVER01 TaxID=3075406 RepID=UPI002AD56724|nr:hypothetical protein [Nostoc sp. EfeVER01]MDZ7948715.1 hypothetical protein [Nostoc sp. EfeVER01]
MSTTVTELVVPLRGSKLRGAGASRREVRATPTGNGLLCLGLEVSDYSFELYR